MGLYPGNQQRTATANGVFPFLSLLPERLLLEIHLTTQRGRVVSGAPSENSECSGGNDSPMFAVTSLLECLTPENNTNITSVRIVLFQHVRLDPSSGPSPFDVHLRTAPSARFSC